MRKVETAPVEGDGRAADAPIIHLRPNIRLPNWSIVTSSRAREALKAIIHVTGGESKWSNLEEAEDRTRRAVLDLYVRLGRAPTLAGVGETVGLDVEEIRSYLGRLKTRDMVVLDEERRAILGAYPFSESRSGHRVRLGGHTLNAMCAIDALGVGAMYDLDADISSSCHECDTEIRVAIREGGHKLVNASPPGVVVWSGIHYEDNAATSLCTVLVFFCSESHAHSWRARNPQIEGFLLSLEEGFQVGRAIFMHLLGPGRRFS